MIISYDKKINRKVRVFISSTFSDMKKERDIIVHSVFPRLRREFTPKMIDINEVDLRWGIPEEDSETSKILEICIGEVLHCLPFFVGIVGQNYGSIASREAIENLPPAYRKAVGGDLPDNTSITELEMRAGVFIPKNADFSSFFLKKNIDKKEILPQLERLITNINSGYNTYTYDNLKMFENEIYTSLKTCISKLIPERLDIPYDDKYYYSHLRVLKNNVVHYIPNVLFISEIEERLLKQRQIYLKGNKGIGKSACVSWLAKREGVDRDNNIFFHFAAAGNESLNIDNAFFRLRLYLQTIQEYKGEEKDNRAIVTELLSKLPTDFKLTFYFDALDQFNDVTAVYQFFALTNIHPNVFVICSGTEEYVRIPKEQTILMNNLTSDQIRQILKGSLKPFGKKLDEEMKQKIIAKKSCANPLFLQAFITQLRMYGTYDDHLDMFFEELLCADSFAGIFNIVIRRLKEYFEETGLKKEVVDEALALIVYSNNGIRENEFQEILNIMPITRSVFLSTIEMFTIEEDGLIRFNHDLIISEVKNSLNTHIDINYEKFIAMKLIDYFSKQPYDWRRFSEEPFQLCRLNKTDALVESLSNKECFMYLRRNKYHSLVGYLAYLVDEQLDLSSKLIIQFNEEEKVAAAEIFCQAGCHNAAIFIVKSLLDEKKPPEKYIQLLDILARSQYKLGLNDYKDSISTYKTLLNYYKNEYPEDQIGYAARAYLLGVVYKTSGKLDLSAEKLKECAKIYSKDHITTPTAIWAMDVYGESCYTFGKLKKALDIFNKNIRTCTDLYGKSSPELAWSYCYGWNVLYALGDRTTALEKIREAYKIYFQIYLGRGTKVAWAALNAGIASLIKNNLEKAEKFFRFSIKENDIILEESDRPHRYSITAYANLANLYECKKDTENAVRIINYALRESKKKNGTQHIYTANILLNAGVLERNPQKIQEAIDLYEKQTIQTPDIYFAKVCLARIWALAKNEEKAESTIRNCISEYSILEMETELITYLMLETLDKISGVLSKDELEIFENLYRFDDYKFYLTYNNNSNIIIIPPI